jgi:succinate dehydrogenase / fumarate reductase cytochrome b subunit
MEEKKIKSRPRPLSPHLQVYKPQITSILSITHRATGVALYLCAFLFVAYLYTYAFWQNCDILKWLSENNWGKFLGLPAVFGITFALCYHFCNGIRHLFWDFGKGYEIETVYKSGYAVLFFSILFTLLIWGVVIF